MYITISIVALLISLCVLYQGIKRIKNRNRKSVAITLIVIGLLLSAFSEIFIYLLLSGQVILPLVK